MSKRIAIIENCKGCPYATNSFAACVRTFKQCPDDGIPDWCPLPKLPERMETQGCAAPDTYFRKAMGWNACLDEIGGNDNG